MIQAATAGLSSPSMASILSLARRSLCRGIVESRKLTTAVMMKLMENLNKRGGKRLIEVKSEQLVEAVLDTTDPNVITKGHRAVLRKMMLPLLKNAG